MNAFAEAWRGYQAAAAAGALGRGGWEEVAEDGEEPDFDPPFTEEEVLQWQAQRDAATRRMADFLVAGGGGKWILSDIPCAQAECRGTPLLRSALSGQGNVFYCSMCDKKYTQRGPRMEPMDGHVPSPTKAGKKDDGAQASTKREEVKDGLLGSAAGAGERKEAGHREEDEEDDDDDFDGSETEEAEEAWRITRMVEQRTRATLQKYAPNAPGDTTATPPSPPPPSHRAPSTMVPRVAPLQPSNSSSASADATEVAKQAVVEKIEWATVQLAHTSSFGESGEYAALLERLADTLIALNRVNR